MLETFGLVVFGTLCAVVGGFAALFLLNFLGGK